MQQLLTKKYLAPMILLIVLTLILAFWILSDQTDPTKPSHQGNQRISIASQFGMAYAPLTIMEQQDYLSPELPAGTRIVWTSLSNTASIREAMIAGEVDLGFMAIPPFLIGLENGMDWRIATGLSQCPTGLVTSDPTLKSLGDIRPTDRIALPQPGSVQHILLAMAANQVFSDPKRFDKNLIALSHPDGYQAMIAKKDVFLHFTTPPFLEKELQEPGYAQLISGEKILGQPFSFIVGACPVSFQQEQPALYQGFLRALEKTLVWMETNPEETVILLSQAYGITPEETSIQLEQMQFDTEVRGVEPLLEFMIRTDFLKSDSDAMGLEDPSSLYFHGVIHE